MSNRLIGLLHKRGEIKKNVEWEGDVKMEGGREEGGGWSGGKWINHSLMEWQDQWAKEWVSVAAPKARAHSHMLRSVPTV